MTKPKPLKKENMKFDEVIKLAKENINEIAKGEDQDSDTKHYIYEEVMEAVFGENVWEWINSKQ